ncbi:hypothetical protein A2V54_03415 [candidate division WWE3 bacterium RBG_19FT_COMBO_53_11]|uniref:Uncharacterized protein n=1 Tax=candidate division WWE3 bacterium RBG_19FT_COMBO_53_11 TaxID=1802613 RepID=A0A1F4UHF8_UNCKA|nr:MAG: hypothetical protein A2155_02245 [candidate division WWE3 bacterium RBG_16_52_45]OGC44398.1 MAG: hypothetical protein A2V54_03415 [candidate division WWE3 bacterium RBG_19FT_COMBO_53_11]
MGLPLKLRFWRWHRNPISRYRFRLFEYEVRSLARKAKDALAIVQPEEIQRRKAIFKRYEEDLEEGRFDTPLRPLVEEMVASDISEALGHQGIWFPPVAFCIQVPPTTLIISARSKIYHAEGSINNTLLRWYLSPMERQEIEEYVEKLDQRLSALVVDAAGLSTLPPMSAPYPAQKLVKVAGHEWGHIYFWLSPLGISTSIGGNKNGTLPINEAACQVVSEEISQMIGAKYGWEEVEEEPGEDVPDFDQTMLSIRKKVDKLLEEGKIEEAEAFMEESRCRLNEVFFPPTRKLNQAYFAFFGNYELGASGDDQTPKRIRELRNKLGSLSDFLKAIRRVTSAEDFENLLQKYEID